MTTVRIDSGPIPNDDGDVVFVVEAHGYRIEVLASPLGIGTAGDNGEMGTIAVQEVMEYAASHRAEMTQMYRSAAGLRRAAGKPPPLPAAQPSDVKLVGNPRSATSNIVIPTRVSGVQVDVFIFVDGNVIDHCDDWERVTDLDRNAAMQRAIEWVLEDAERASAMGVDAALIAELWR